MCSFRVRVWLGVCGLQALWGMLVGAGRGAGAACWVRRGAAGGLPWLATMQLGWWVGCGSAVRALWSGACGGLVRLGVVSKLPDYLRHVLRKPGCCSWVPSWLAPGVICSGSCGVWTWFGWLGGLPRVSLVCMHGAAGSGGLGVVGWERATRRCAFESLSLSLSLSLRGMPSLLITASVGRRIDAKKQMLLRSSLVRTSARGYASKSAPGLKNVVLIDGCRIPFQPCTRLLLPAPNRPTAP